MQGAELTPGDLEEVGREALRAAALEHRLRHPVVEAADHRVVRVALADKRIA